jgi:antitoxin VapB
MATDDGSTRYRTRLFQNGNSQAVRIPKDLAYPRSDMDMEIERQGDRLVVSPARQRLTGVAAAFRDLGADFMADGRDTPEVPDRGWDDGDGGKP